MIKNGKKVSREYKSKKSGWNQCRGRFGKGRYEPLGPTQSAYSKYPNRKMKGREYKQLLRSRRDRIIKGFFINTQLKDTSKRVLLPAEVGLEGGPEAVQSFFDLGNEIIDCDALHLELDFSKVIKIWPSTIALLSSLTHWKKLAFRHADKTYIHSSGPSVRSSTPEDKKAEAYLTHCGFYEYVGRSSDSNTKDSHYDDSATAEIQRQTKKDEVEERGEQLTEIVRRFADFTQDQMEIFTDKIIYEILMNASEHGVSISDKGWWIIAQYHKTHKFISICVSDNGIGFRKNLLSGPQGNDVLIKIGDKKDVDYIIYALQEKISGAWNAISSREKEKGLFSTRFPKGRSRGNGLKRVVSGCVACRIKLTIVSHYGYVSLNTDGTIERCESGENRLFAGTLYQMIIPAKSL